MTKTRVQCPRCGYEWETKSEMYHVSCPSCRKLVKIRDIPVEVQSDGSK